MKEWEVTSEEQRKRPGKKRTQERKQQFSEKLKSWWQDKKNKNSNKLFPSGNATGIIIV